MPLDALFSDELVLPHGFNALHKELSSGGHEADGDDDYTEANPRVGLGVLHREVAFPLSVGIRGGWVVFESVILARGVVQEDPRGTNFTFLPSAPPHILLVDLKQSDTQRHSTWG